MKTATRAAPALAFVTLLIPLPALFGQAQEYNFKDPKGVNSVSFVLDSELEPIMGYSGGISGAVNFDANDPKKLTGKIVIAANSVRCVNDEMTKKLHSAEWLDVDKHPEISFELKSVDAVKPDAKGGANLELDATGVLTCHGIKKELKVKVQVSPLAGRVKERGAGRGGDLLAMRSQFTVKRSDFQLGQPLPLVADEMQIRVAIVGYSVNKAASKQE